MILNQINNQIDRIENYSKAIYGGDSHQKVKELVVYLANTFGLNENQFLNVALSPEDLANLSGISKTYMRKL